MSKPIPIRISDDVLASLDFLAEALGVSRNALIVDAIKRAIATDGASATPPAVIKTPAQAHEAVASRPKPSAKGDAKPVSRLLNTSAQAPHPTCHACGQRHGLWAACSAASKRTKAG